MKRLAIVVPCYNEEEMLPITFKELTTLLVSLIKKGKITPNSFVMYVDDGSADNTWKLIEDQYKRNRFAFGVKLSHNAGHQKALLCGLETANKIADFTISIDADLQDDIGVIEEMVDKFNEGFDVVYGVRNNRKSDSVFKRTTAQGFYKTVNAMGAKSVYNHADFRLMSQRAVEALLKYKESNLYLRGIVPMVGYNSTCVYYSRKERQKGESKYPLKKMLSFAFDGITSMSIKPLSLITALGIIIVILSIAAAIYTLTSLIIGIASPGWASIMLSIWFIGGVQLIAIGLIGQYVGKTYMESKHRPRYNIETTLIRDNFNNDR